MNGVNQPRNCPLNLEKLRRTIANPHMCCWDPSALLNLFTHAFSMVFYTIWILRNLEFILAFAY